VGEPRGFHAENDPVSWLGYRSPIALELTPGLPRPDRGLFIAFGRKRALSAKLVVVDPAQVGSPIRRKRTYVIDPGASFYCVTNDDGGG
jgi:hypothetical protein